MDAVQILLAICVLYLALPPATPAPSARRSRAASAATVLPSDPTRATKLTSQFKETTTTEAPKPSHRKNKALNFLGFFPSFLSSGLDYGEDDDDVTFAVNDDNFDNEDLSRTLPARRRPQQKKPSNYAPAPQNSINSLQYDNSPIFYIRLPPTPYMFVPGLGYVSQPPNLGPPMAPPQVDPFINVPIDFVSNGKPTNVYQWPGAGFAPQDPYGFGAPAPAPYRPPAPVQPSYDFKPQRKPQPTNSKVTNLKAPFLFNGKPNDSVFVLRDSYNSLYSDALQNFYP